MSEDYLKLPWRRHGAQLIDSDNVPVCCFYDAMQTPESYQARISYFAQQEALLTLYREALEYAGTPNCFLCGVVDNHHQNYCPIGKALALTPEEALKIMTERGRDDTKSV